MVLFTKVLLINKPCNVVCGLLNMKKQLLLKSLFLFLSRISFRRYYEKYVKNRGLGKKIQWRAGVDLVGEGVVIEGVQTLSLSSDVIVFVCH